jgi:phosphoribosylformylglycinamidine synthase
MCLGSNLGCRFDPALTREALFGYSYGAFVLEVSPDVSEGTLIGTLTDDAVFSQNGMSIPLSELSSLYDGVLESVYPTRTGENVPVETLSCEEAPRTAAHIKSVRPRVLIPAFPGTNCEYDSARAVEDAGAEAQVMVLNNLTPDGIARSVERFAEALKSAQMVFIPGGFSGGDEPDGSGKFITAFFRSAAIREQVTELLEKRDGLMCGICNGFQALIKLGLVPYGKIIDTDASCPTLTYNTIGRHQSKIVRVRVVSNRSPWLAATHVGDIYSVPISHGEGRFISPESLIRSLAANGQIATQYVDADGNATSDIRYNPNGSLWAVEGITSPDGRVFGKMGHAERIGAGLYKNVPGEYDMQMFVSAVRYFK